jgi:hypothetical protein
MERHAREARAAKLAAAAASASRDKQQQHNQDSASTAPDDDAPMSILPVHEGEPTKDPAELSPSPETPTAADSNSPTSTRQPDTSPQVSVRLV